MNYHPLINGNYRQKIQKNYPSISHNQSLAKSRDKHVTFRQINQPNTANNQLSNSKYHFTYNQPYQNASFNPIPIHPQFLHQQNSPFSRAPLQNSPHREVQAQLYQNLSANFFKPRSVSNNKRKLKIFPQKYDKPIQPKIPQNKNREPNQIGELKGQIQKLRQQINNLALNLSKNTSRDFTESVYKNQADRTKRLSQLNDFNQKLYSQLAMKLKQISFEQYENAIQIQNSNKKFLESVYSSVSKERPHQTFDFDKGPQDHHKFMDIQEFEKEYQEKYSQGEKSPNKTLNMDKLADDQVELDSPFLIHQNALEMQGFKTIQPDPSRRKEKHDPFTFHKETSQQQRHFRKTQQRRVKNDKVIEVGNMNMDTNIREIRQNKQNPLNQQKPSQRKPLDLQRQARQKKQIHDMNRQIENRIMRKRSTSEYAYLCKARKY